MYLFNRAICLAFPDLDFYLAPTTSHSLPTWFTSAQPSISKLVLDQVQVHQTRILPLPGFVSDPSHLEPDGVHFLAAPGMRYCMHLIDSARYQVYLFTNISRRPCYLLYAVQNLQSFSLIYLEGKSIRGSAHHVSQLTHF
jgi:hypothetical protein